MFVDEVSIEVAAGKGGNGALSFRREKYEPYGGPDGGNGGDGGSIVLVADNSVSTLLDFRYRKIWKAPPGKHAEGGNRHGKKGEDLHIPVPVGTVVKDEQGRVLTDLIHPGQKITLARGGKGGRGNRSFATSRNRTPRMAEKGEPGESKRIFLELKLMADVGIVGLPNAGKSTLLSRISAARPKIADYQFTTLSPQLGVVKYGDDSFVVADLPGIIEGASQGSGLGFRFLKHCERTSILLLLIDISPWPEEDPLTALKKLEQELANFSEALTFKPRMIVGNKIDLEGASDALNNLQEAVSHDERVVAPVIGISAATGDGLDKFLEQVSTQVTKYREKIPTSQLYEETIEPTSYLDEEATTVFWEGDAYVVEGKSVESLVARTDFNNPEAVQRFWKITRKMGINEMLLEQGVKPGDTVRIGQMEFTYQPEDE